MNIDPEISADEEAAQVFKPIDELLATEDDELKSAREALDELERKFKKVYPPAKRDDEE